MSAVPSDVTLTLSRAWAKILTSVAASLIIGLIVQAFAMWDSVRSIKQWIEYHEKSEAMPRSEFALEKQLLLAQIEQLRARIELTEDRDR